MLSIVATKYIVQNLFSINAKIVVKKDVLMILTNILGRYFYVTVCIEDRIDNTYMKED
jgi:hypothetical protein